MKHIAVFDIQEAEEILNGEKRKRVWQSSVKSAPWGVCSSGDIVYIKPKGKEIIGQFKIKKIEFIDGEEEGLKYSTTIYMGESVRLITSPIKLSKKTHKNWIVLE